MYDELIERLRSHNGWALNETLDKAANAIEDLENKLNLWRQDKISRWIPVTERLPQRKPDDIEYPTVLVELNDGSVNIACYYESTKKWGIGEEYCCLCEPTHWMPLPEPPKEGE